MSDLNQHISIPKDTASNDDLDYAFLRRIGQRHIEQLSGSLWTDYNEHDPGITMLEMLCYAITDLGMRLQLPLENILAPENKTAQKIEEQFFKASQILPSKPVTENDYRKLFIDIEGVKNCWLKPFRKTVYVDCKNDKLSYNSKSFKAVHEDFKKEFELKGLYSVVVDFDEEIEKKNQIDKITKEIKKRFHANRNLCEDLIEITEVKKHPISVCAKIELFPECDEELVHAQILLAIDNYFSPPVKFYSLKQMFSKGYSADEIFEGPVLENGFIDYNELEAAGLRSEVRLSDIMQIIMDIEGVKNITEISINDCFDPFNETDSWLICIENSKPVRCPDSAFSYFIGVLPVNINFNKVEKYLSEIKATEKTEFEQAKIDKEIEVPEGVYLNTSETTTIQNDFPETYGIGQTGLRASVETARKSKAKQLKGYLLFFDQILASYFAHLGKVKDLLSVDNKLKKTYFTQAVKDSKGLDELVKNYPVNNDDELTEILFAELDNPVERKNKILDHLMARFAERFTDFTFLMKELYGSFAPKAILLSKESFLRDYPETSSHRGNAFNWYKQPETNLWDTGNVAGVQKRIARLIGMKNYKRRNLSDSLVEIYNPDETDSNPVYRWRIRNKTGDIILSSTENYSSQSQAEKEMYFAVVKIIETAPETVKKAFQNTIHDEDEIGNFEIQISQTGQYSFDVINTEAPVNSTDRIIARQFSYYSTQKELRNGILGIIEFMTHDFTEEGMFLVEHILLRPDVTKSTLNTDLFMPLCTQNCESCEPVDPYSYRITVVLPGWTYRFSNPDFRNFLGELIRKEIPAHILARICWIGYRINYVPDEENEMLNFEKAYKDFLYSKTNNEQAQNQNKLKDFIQILSELNSIYPKGKLIDCNEEDDKTEGRIILGQTNIGNL